MLLEMQEIARKSKIRINLFNFQQISKFTRLFHCGYFQQLLVLLAFHMKSLLNITDQLCLVHLR